MSPKQHAGMVDKIMIAEKLLSAAEDELAAGRLETASELIRDVAELAERMADTLDVYVAMRNASAPADPHPRPRHPH